MWLVNEFFDYQSVIQRNVFEHFNDSLCRMSVAVKVVYLGCFISKLRGNGLHDSVKNLIMSVTDIDYVGVAKP